MQGFISISQLAVDLIDRVTELYENGAEEVTGGERQEETEWHRVVLFDRLAEIAGEYLKKGRPVYIEGRLRTRKWTDKDGVEKSTHREHVGGDHPRTQRGRA